MRVGGAKPLRRRRDRHRQTRRQRLTAVRAPRKATWRIPVHRNARWSVRTTVTGHSHGSHVCGRHFCGRHFCGRHAVAGQLAGRRSGLKQHRTGETASKPHRMDEDNVGEQRDHRPERRHHEQTYVQRLAMPIAPSDDATWLRATAAPRGQRRPWLRCRSAQRAMARAAEKCAGGRKQARIGGHRCVSPSIGLSVALSA
jgi:hypothetical protein